MRETLIDYCQQDPSGVANCPRAEGQRRLGVRTRMRNWWRKSEGLSFCWLGNAPGSAMEIWYGLEEDECRKKLDSRTIEEGACEESGVHQVT